MDIAEINKRIEQAKADYQRKMLQLEKQKTKAKEHYQRTIEHLKSQKEKCKANPVARLEAKIELQHKDIIKLIEDLCSVVEQAEY